MSQDPQYNRTEMPIRPTDKPAMQMTIEKPLAEAKPAEKETAAKGKFRPRFRTPSLPRETKVGLGIIAALLAIFGYVLYQRLNKPWEIDTDEYVAGATAAATPKTTTDVPPPATLLPAQPHSPLAQHPPQWNGAPQQPEGNQAAAGDPFSLRAAGEQPAALYHDANAPHGTAPASNGFVANSDGVVSPLGNEMPAPHDNAAAAGQSAGDSFSPNHSETPRQFVKPSANPLAIQANSSNEPRPSYLPLDNGTANAPAIKGGEENLQTADIARVNAASNNGAGATADAGINDDPQARYSTAVIPNNPNNSNPRETGLNYNGLSAAANSIPTTIQEPAKNFLDQTDQFQDQAGQLASSARNVGNDLRKAAANSLNQLNETANAASQDSLTALRSAAQDPLANNQTGVSAAAVNPMRNADSGEPNGGNVTQLRALAGMTDETPTANPAPNSAAAFANNGNMANQQPAETANALRSNGGQIPPAGNSAEQPIRIPSEAISLTTPARDNESATMRIAANNTAGNPAAAGNPFSNNAYPNNSTANAANPIANSPYFNPTPAFTNQPANTQTLNANPQLTNPAATNPTPSNIAAANNGNLNFTGSAAANAVPAEPSRLRFSAPNAREIPAPQTPVNVNPYPRWTDQGGTRQTGFENAPPPVGQPSTTAPIESTKRAAQPRPQNYVVQAQDSYWTIAERVYGSGSYYKALYEHNRRISAAADRLQPGTEIAVPDLNMLRENYPELLPRTANDPNGSLNFTR